MIEIKNIVEDIVYDFVDNLEESRNGEINKNQRREICAYVLNRVKPMYITSNKGFTNVIVKYQNDPQFLADIMMQISGAMKVVKKSYVAEMDTIDLNLDQPHYVFPKVYGKLISSRDLLPVESARVSLFIDDHLASTLSSSWNNPTEIAQRDEGIFSFAPKPEEAHVPLIKKTFTIMIKIEKDGKEFIKKFQHECSPTLLTSVELNFHENVMQLEDIYISL